MKDYSNLINLKNKFLEIRHCIPDKTLTSFAEAFDVEYTHNSTAIEGNTLSLLQTKAVIEDGISVGGKTLREIYEVVNHSKAYNYVKKCIAEQLPLSEKIVKEIHFMLMNNIIIGGIYRNEDVLISGAEHIPPTPNQMYNQIKNFYLDLNEKALDPINLAAWTHAEFVKIHPFLDGNGRTSRLIMNFQLMSHGFLPVSIAKENRLEYFESLEEYALRGDIEPFADIIADLEEQRLTRFINSTRKECV
ncbi:cell division protein Fic [Clostridia bacterium]|nr:cell division protein Fic [Clostridia bacterium]